MARFHMVKKFAMTLVWRISQTGPILSLFFWSAALAGIFWPIIGKVPDGPLWVFLTDVLRIPGTRATVVGILFLFFVFAAFIMLIGYLYDRVFMLWREQMHIAMDRNPYADHDMLRKEVLMWEQYYLPLARAVYKISPDPDLREAIDRVERWVATGRIEPTNPTRPKVP